MKKKLSKSSLANASTGLSALKMGDYETAERLLSSAAKANRRDQGIWVNLGIAQQALGDIESAVITMSEALAMAPNIIEAARPFQALVSRYDIANPAALNASGLKAALGFETLERQPLVELAFSHASSERDLAGALEQCRNGDADQAAEALLAKRTAKGLQNELLAQALRLGKNTNRDIETLLCALRRHIILHITPQRLQEDHALFSLILALISQLITNEYLWPITDEERSAAAAITLDRDALYAGDITQACLLCLTLLYRPLAQTRLADANEPDIAKIRPKAFASLLAKLIGERASEARIAEQLPSYGSISDATSLKVAGQYETSPYPRWTSLHVSKPGTLQTALGQFFSQEKLAFMETPYDVLIAGCGTGQQGARAASSYGPNANLLAIDLSKASLAYAQRMSEQFAIETIKFAQADILDVAQIGRQFDIIESVGVLHHMGEPFKGWQALIDQLKPGGLMYIGLYSAIARAEINALRQEKIWPGAGCSDQDARAYRAALLARGDEISATMSASQDFYSLSEFRDLLLHESEQQMSIDQIREFLDQSGLIFRGFTLPAHTTEHFLSHYPDDPFPGKLENWAELETTHRSLFDGMYLFWCEKPL